KAYHAFFDSRSLLSWGPEAKAVASRRLRQLRYRFFCVSVPGQGLVEPHGSECRMVGKQFASADARNRDRAVSSGLTDFIYWAFGRARLHRPLLQLREL